MAEERISELEYISIETSKTEKEIEQRQMKWNRVSKDCGETTTDAIYTQW